MIFQFLCSSILCSVCIVQSPWESLGSCDFLQPLLQHEELCGVPLLGFCGLLLVVSPQTLHLLCVTLLLLQVFLLSLSL